MMDKTGAINEPRGERATGQWVFRRVADAANWLAGEAHKLAGTGRIIILETIDGTRLRAWIEMTDAARGVLAIGCEDGTRETVEVAEMLSVRLTDAHRMTPERAYDEMRSVERDHGL